MMWAEPGGWPDLHGFGGLRKGKWMNTMNTGMKSGKSGIQIHTHTQAVPIVLIGRKHQLDRICGKRPLGRVPNKKIAKPKIESTNGEETPKLIELQAKDPKVELQTRDQPRSRVHQRGKILDREEP